MQTPNPYLLPCPTCRLDFRPIRWQIGVYCPSCKHRVYTIRDLAMPFGKYRGCRIVAMDLPAQMSYLRWVIENIAALNYEVRITILCQLGAMTVVEAEPDNSPWWAQVLGLSPIFTALEVKACYRQCAKLSHPDAGGSTEAMQRLNTARQEAIHYLTTNL